MTNRVRPAGGMPTPEVLRERLAPSSPPLLPELTILRATPTTNLGSLALGGRSPYWAYAWPGGCLLARYLLDHPDTVEGRSVLDVGTGCGVVAIAAARAGSLVFAVDIDPAACSAASLNATANGVTVEVRCADAFRTELPVAQIVLAGDLFYDRGVARQATIFLDARRAAGADILVGDIGRRHLPRGRLTELAGYDLPDFGSSEAKRGSVYRWNR